MALAQGLVLLLVLLALLAALGLGMLRLGTATLLTGLTTTALLLVTAQKIMRMPSGMTSGMTSA